jgi:hypothetical protein
MLRLHLKKLEEESVNNRIVIMEQRLYRTSNACVFQRRSDEITTVAWHMSVLCSGAERQRQAGSLILSISKHHLFSEDHLQSTKSVGEEIK